MITSFCYCTLAVGEKYHQLTKIFLDTFVKYTNDICIVVTDCNHTINSSDQVIQIPIDRFDGHPINLKWMPYYHALELGYETVCFIDSDSTVSETYNKVDILNSIQDGFGCNWFLSYGKDFKTKRRGSVKLKALVREDDTYPILCPVECFMILHGNVDRSINFINEWRQLQQQIADRKLHAREVCHEIGLAAKRAGLPIYKYKDGRSTYLKNFKHYGGGAKKHMIQ